MTLRTLYLVILMALTSMSANKGTWHSSYVWLLKNGSLAYKPDAQGNTIPDFSGVGYKGGDATPDVPVVATIEPSGERSRELIQKAIDEVSLRPLDRNGFRGAILFKKGRYPIDGSIYIRASGIVLRGEGAGTEIFARAALQHDLLVVNGSGKRKEIHASRRKITDAYVPAGAKSFQLNSVKGLKKGDRIIVFRPGTANWIADLKMDQIEVRDSTTKQWASAEYDLHYERTITKIKNKRIYLDYPVVMAMESNYGGGEVYRYSFDGRISNVGIENLSLVSAYANDTDEQHGWNAIFMNRVQDGWVKNVTARYFGYSCVNLGEFARNVTVDSCRYLQPKSIITGGRRYSFNNDGQLNLVKNCFASEGRHDYVTGARVMGPNVFYNCRSEKAKADIGPHHRWATGTLYDNIITDGEINMQDRGNWGTGHGWSGVNQVFWNCTASKAAIQDPWVSGRNYVIGMKALKIYGRLNGRKSSEWENQDGELEPASLYLSQVKARQLKSQ